MPKATARLEIDLTVTHAQFRRIAHGLIPERMEDRWFIYLDDDTLQVHRTGTGVCVYQVVFALCPEGVRVKQARVNRDKNQYPATNDAYDASQLDALLKRLAREAAPNRSPRVYSPLDGPGQR
jgi:hypothetical protein